MQTRRGEHRTAISENELLIRSLQDDFEAPVSVGRLEPRWRRQVRSQPVSAHDPPLRLGEFVLGTGAEEYTGLLVDERR